MTRRGMTSRGMTRRGMTRREHGMEGGGHGTIVTSYGFKIFVKYHKI